jgi:Ran GTPase-activating protein (RanGAP) involved in mRNA processing and transport
VLELDCFVVFFQTLKTEIGQKSPIADSGGVRPDIVKFVDQLSQQTLPLVCVMESDQ